jgi:Xaa-Pro aminopeptidase
MTAAIAMTAPPEVYRQRRRALAGRIPRPLVLFAGHAPARNYPDNAYPFRAGSTYRYFGGPSLEHAALLIEPGSDGAAGCTLFRPAPGPDDALWMGPAVDDETIASHAGLAPASIADGAALAERLAGRDSGAIIPQCVHTVATAAQLNLAPATADELLAIIDMRLGKDEYELAAMRNAARISMAAHRAALAAARPGRREADVAAAYHAVLVAHECLVAFNPIITIRGETLHLHGHANVMPDGALALVDAGGEEPTGYACDITRTFPVSGRWTPLQRDLYEIVERALDDAVIACTPGTRYRDVHDRAARVICEGLVAVGLLRGNPEDLLARRAHAPFFPHGVGHLIGMDTHDMEDFGDLAGYAPGRSRRTDFGDYALRLDRDLAPGMCVTVEPGIYFVPAIWQRDDIVGPLADAVDRDKVDELLRCEFGGIRIEHTICVRATGGPEVLSGDLPTDADQVARLVGTA